MNRVCELIINLHLYKFCQVDVCGYLYIQGRQARRNSEGVAEVAKIDPLLGSSFDKRSTL